MVKEYVWKVEKKKRTFGLKFLKNVIFWSNHLKKGDFGLILCENVEKKGKSFSKKILLWIEEILMVI